MGHPRCWLCRRVKRRPPCPLEARGDVGNADRVGNRVRTGDSPPRHAAVFGSAGDCAALGLAERVALWIDWQRELSTASTNSAVHVAAGASELHQSARVGCRCRGEGVEQVFTCYVLGVPRP